jgi:hypothetical protein
MQQSRSPHETVQMFLSCNKTEVRVIQQPTVWCHATAHTSVSCNRSDISVVQNSPFVGVMHQSRVQCHDMHHMFVYCNSLLVGFMQLSIDKNRAKTDQIFVSCNNPLVFVLENIRVSVMLKSICQCHAIFDFFCQAINQRSVSCSCPDIFCHATVHTSVSCNRSYISVMQQPRGQFHASVHKTVACSRPVIKMLLQFRGSAP